MANRSDLTSPSTNVQQIAKTFRQTGWISFWVQLVLAVVSSIILLFAIALSGQSQGSSAPSTGIGVAVTLMGIGVLGFNMYWALSRYVAIGKKLGGNPVTRPKKADTIQAIRTGLIASLAGILLSLVGAQATVGLLAAKAFSQGVGGFVNTDASKFIQPLDVLVVQASTNVILAQFAGIVAALWLLNRMSR
jgi:Protein of unknown function (DUF3611)